MSVQQLNRLVIEKDKLMREFERTKTIIKVSEACDVSFYSFKKEFYFIFFEISK